VGVVIYGVLHRSGFGGPRLDLVCVK